MSLSLIKHHAMTYVKWRYGIRNVGTGWWQVITHSHPGNSFRYALDRSMSEPDHFCRKSLLSLLALEPRYLGRLARRLAIKLSESPRPLSNLSFTTNSPVLSPGLNTKRQRRSEGEIPRISDLSNGPRRTVCFALWSLQTQGKPSRFLYDREPDNTKVRSRNCDGRRNAQ